MLWGGSRVLAQDDTGEAGRVRYFPETHHTVTGDFLAFYESASNPKLVFGYPITEAYQDQSKGRLVQYFERARFVYYPENPEELRVKLTSLGEIFHEKTAEFPTQGNLPGCRYYPESGKYVCYAFLELFKAHGDAAQFGYPISNFEIRDGRIVQYFQRARFEWHPELPTGQKVQLTDLGRQYFDLLGENPKLLLPISFLGELSLIEKRVIKLQARAFLQYASTHQQGQQTVTVIVQDQNLVPVTGADITLEITFPSGETQRNVVPETTDKNGAARYTFTFTDQPIGLATVKASAVYNQLGQETTTPYLHQETTTSFMIWY